MGSKVLKWAQILKTVSTWPHKLKNLFFYAQKSNNSGSISMVYKIQLWLGIEKGEKQNKIKEK